MSLFPYCKEILSTSLGAAGRDVCTS